MNRILLDTSGYAGFMKGHRGIHAHLRSVDEIYINPVVLGELLSGFIRGRHRVRNEIDLSDFLSSPRANVIPMDYETSKRYAVILGRLRDAGTPVPTNDLWIASSAMQYGLTIVTMDRHFLKISEILVECFNPS